MASGKKKTADEAQLSFDIGSAGGAGSGAKENADAGGDKLARMKGLVELLNEARRAYYQEDREIMPNIEYDRLEQELIALEKETGTTLSNSPTVNVGYQILSDLPKEAHPTRILSLDKTKDRDALSEWLGTQRGVLSWKLDGLTVVLTYEGGRLAKAVTRGNGDIGEVITENARMFANLPAAIPFTGRLVIRGEALITYSDFEAINRSIGDSDAKYKNPRNLCSGSVRQLNTRITKERNVRFFAFSMGEAEGKTFRYRHEQLDWLAALGFDVVERHIVKNIPGSLESDEPGVMTVLGGIHWFEERIAGNDCPSDGLVLLMDDIAYGESLGNTVKFPRDAIAFKWADEKAETTLLDVEWSASRTGLINPIAVFEPVELEGTTVSRASVHNVNILRELKLGIGDTVTVYKANMIIPQIAENLTGSGTVRVPDTCPVCGGRTLLKSDNGVEALYCVNDNCPAKHLKSFAHFVSRDAMNVDGLSEATLEKLVGLGLIKEFADIFRIDRFRDEIVQMEGFGEKSFANLVDAVRNAAANADCVRLLYSLGIPGIGLANAKMIARRCGYDWQKMQALTAEELTEIDGVGDVLAGNYTAYFADPASAAAVADILKEITLPEPAAPADPAGEAPLPLAGLTFVITGSLNGFANRNELRDLIEQLGGKVSGSVSAKTSYLINNDNMSSSTKNKTARSLGVPVITEEEFNAMVGRSAE